MLATLQNNRTLITRASVFFLCQFFFLRWLSYTLSSFPLHQGIIVLASIGSLVYLYTRVSPTAALFFLLAELILGGSGQFFELFSLSLRSWLFISFLSCTAISFLHNPKAYWRGKRIDWIIFMLLFITSLAALNGYLLGNDSVRIISDSISFSYLLLFFPLRYIYEQKKYTTYIPELMALGIAFIVANLIWSLLLFSLFSLEISILQDPFYKWLRDVAAGKLTFLGQGFWRIVFPTHLLFIPLFALLHTFIIHIKTTRKIQYFFYLLYSCTLLILIINFSRAYLLAAFAILLLSLYNTPFKTWFKQTVKSIVLFFFLFCSLSFIASAGQSFGLEILGLRSNSFIAPETELSTATRITLLSPIIQKIIEQPYLGHGLGATVIFTDFNTYTKKETPQFDWGYLELWVEFGLFGLILLLGSLCTLVYKLLRDIHHMKGTDILCPKIILLGIIGLGISTVFGPVLFHVFGIVLLCLFSLYAIPRDTT